MSIPRINNFVILAVWLGLFLQVILSIGTEATAAEETPAAADTLVEKPSLPYLTLMLVRDPVVHQELKLDSKQVALVQAAVAKVDHSFWLLRDVPVAQCQEKLDQNLKTLREGVAASLTAEQQKRLDEIILQARGLKSLAAPDVAQKLQLSESQLAKIRAVISSPQDATNSKKRAPTASKNAPAKASHDEQYKKVLDVLSAKQAAQLTKLVGKPADLSKVRRIGGMAPELRGVTAWMNSNPLTLKSQQGKVVAVHFWTFGCINCTRNLPHYQGWYEKFPKDELTIIGLHTPEIEGEKVVDNVREHVTKRGIRYPIAVDGASENWKAWGNSMWPSVYLIDKQGQIRYWYYGELNWEGAKGEEFMRQKIAELLAEE
ncbi:MAG: redoxin domain-containing protein [Planctomycetota bacterium]|nr:redoxin domain-containing protein [Planctomycetota bacterium]